MNLLCMFSNCFAECCLMSHGIKVFGDSFLNFKTQVQFTEDFIFDS